MININNNEMEDRAKHFINFFGDSTLNVIQQARKTGNKYNEELFKKVEELLPKKV